MVYLDAGLHYQTSWRPVVVDRPGLLIPSTKSKVISEKYGLQRGVSLGSH